MRFMRNKLTVAILILSVGFLILIGYSIKRDSKSVLESSAGTIFNGIQGVVYNGSDEVRDFFYLIFNFSEVKQEYESMRKRNAELEDAAAKYDVLKKENETLRSMLDYKGRNEQFNLMGANIINRVGNGMIEAFTIDKGTKDGVKKGSIVVTHEGLVGQITSVELRSSIVETLGNENIAVAAMVENTRESNGIVKGLKDRKNNLLAKIYSLPLESNVKPGDVITTSDDEFVYPKGIRIGQVIEVEEDKGKVMKNAIIQPFVDLNKIEELLIIVPKDK